MAAFYVDDKDAPHGPEFAKATAEAERAVEQFVADMAKVREEMSALPLTLDNLFLWDVVLLDIVE